MLYADDIPGAGKAEIKIRGPLELFVTKEPNHGRGTAFLSSPHLCLQGVPLYFDFDTKWSKTPEFSK